MNCPNCNKKPVGLLPSFSFGGVGFTKAVQGYFKCKHCGAILRQSKASTIFPKYEKPFWTLYTLLLGGMLGAIWLTYYVMENYMDDENIWIILPVIIVIGLIFFLAMDTMKTRFWVIEETSFEEEVPENEQLSTTGLIVFVAFAIIAIGLFIFLDRTIDTSTMNLTIYTTGAILYMLAVFGGAVLILNKFTGQHTEEAAEQYNVD
ncbi:MAG: hypothetical protein WD022_00600 [Balneolaceae bacterium]